jgi:hypothetical protein
MVGVGLWICDNPATTKPTITATMKDTAGHTLTCSNFTVNVVEVTHLQAISISAVPTFRLIYPDDLASNGVGTTKQALFSSGVQGTQGTWNDVWYQTVESNTTAQIQRHALNFSSKFTVTDNSSNDSTDVDVQAYGTIEYNGTPLTERSILNFESPLRAADSSSPARTDITIDVFGGSGASHSTGAVPDPGAVSGTTRFLREDATWAVVVSGPATSVTVDATAVSTDRLSYTNGTQVTSTTWTYQINGSAATG